jgi:hypothetical protein
MKTSTRTLRRLRGLALALAVAAVAAPAAQAFSNGDYEIESARVQGEAISTYDAIEALRTPPAREVGSLAYELARGAQPPRATDRPYDSIEVARTAPPQAATRLPYDGIELVRSQLPFEAAPVTLVSGPGFAWDDAAVGAAASLAVALLLGSAGLVVARRRASLAAS